MLRFFIGTDDGPYAVVSEGGKVQISKLEPGAVFIYGKYLIIAKDENQLLLFDEKEVVRLRLNYAGLFVKRDSARSCRTLREKQKQASTDKVLENIPKKGENVYIFR